MRQRLGLAAALLRAPRLLVLDEPTNGLDPQGIREMRELLLGLNAEGTTIFLSSHLLAEVEQMCTRVGVLDRGRLVVQDDLSHLQAPTGRTVVVTPDGDVGPRPARRPRRGPRRATGSSYAPTTPATLNRLLVEGGVRVHELGPERRGLEQVVLEATVGQAPGGRQPMIRVELVKMLRRPRTWVTIALLNALPTLVAVLLAVTDIGPRPGEGPPFLSAVLTNGTLFPLAALAIVLPLFLPVAVAVVAGDAIAGEAQRRHAALRADPAGRPHPAAGRQAGRRAGVRAAVGRGGRGRRVRRRHAAAGQRRHQRSSSPGSRAAA